MIDIDSNWKESTALVKPQSTKTKDKMVLKYHFSTVIY